MTALAPDRYGSLHHAAARATLAPSIHNTQPWRFVVGTDRLELYADPRHDVPVVDPRGRQRTISCGAALFGARAALAGAGVDVVTTLLPRPDDPLWLASLVTTGSLAATDATAGRLDDAATDRHSNRRHFAEQQVPDQLCELLVAAAGIEGASLHQVRTLDDRVVLATLTQRAAAAQDADPAYRAELRAWTDSGPERVDGIPAAAVPLAGRSHDDLPLRAMDAGSIGGLPSETESSIDQTLFVLTTPGDTPRDWLVAGQALDRILLELTSAGYVAGIWSQIVEVDSTRSALRHELRLSGHPQLVLRVGLAAVTPATARRPLHEVITDADTVTAVDTPAGAGATTLDPTRAS